MSSFFSKTDTHVKILTPFQENLSLYYNTRTRRIGFLDSEIYSAYPDFNTLEEFNVIDMNKRKIYLLLKYSQWISPILLKFVNEIC